MNLEIRKQGKRKKYYLAHSFREGDKIRKIRRYLGADLSEKNIETLKKRAEILILQQAEAYKSISDPLKQILSKRELLLLKNLEAKGHIRIRHLSEQEWEKFTELFTYNTNAIEGSEVTQKEVKEILEENKWPKEIQKQDISETYGVAQAVRYVRATKEQLSLSMIKKLHAIVFQNSKEFAGKFRAKGIEVVIRDKVGTIIHRGAPSNSVEGLLRELVIWYNENRKKYPPLLLAAVVHNQFENIHPFQDGNGRVGRLLLNNILLKHKLPPVNIGLNNRARYYTALQDYEKRGNIRPTIDLILKEYNELKKNIGAYRK
ncbi:Fic family protein [Candidatus Woesearchaeota archaeon]|nr:Fic family protein [Candidatus Woesearchaeota archaeon]